MRGEQTRWLLCRTAWAAHLASSSSTFSPGPFWWLSQSMLVSHFSRWVIVDARRLMVLLVDLMNKGGLCDYRKVWHHQIKWQKYCGTQVPTCSEQVGGGLCETHSFLAPWLQYAAWISITPPSTAALLPAGESTRYQSDAIEEVISALP